MIKRHIILMLALIALVAGNAMAQPTVEILQVDPSAYPEILFYYKVTDDKGEDVRDQDANEVVVKDNTIKRDLSRRSPECPPPGQSMFSIIFVLDESKTMWDPAYALSDGKTRLDASIDAAKLWIDELPEGRFECCTYSFHSFCNLLNEFSDDKKELKTSFEKIKKQGILTDYNSVFTVDYEGKEGITAQLKIAKYPTYVIFITDGLHKGAGGKMFDLIGAVNAMDEYETKVYSLIINDDASATGDATSISNMTGGQIYSGSGLSSRDRIKEVFDGILAEINETGPPIPCFIKYDTDCDGGTIDFEVPGYGATSANYVIPDNVKPYLEIYPRDIVLEDVTASKDIQIQVTARQNYVDIDDYITDNTKFQIVDWGALGNKFILREDASTTITVRYEPTDDSCSEGELNILESACDSNWVNLIAYMKPYSEEMDCGTATIGGNKPTTFTKVICNKTCTILKIKSAIFENGQAGEFKMNPSIVGMEIEPGDCIEITVEFTPTDVDRRETDFVVEFENGWTTTSKTFGMGSGKATIVADPNPVVFTDRDCQNKTETIDVTLTNNGPVPLTDLVFTLSDDVHFDIVTTPHPTTIAANSSEVIQVAYTPDPDFGNHSATISIAHSGDGSPYVINLSGKYLEVDYTATPNDVIDFGVVCDDGDVHSVIIKMNNTGTMDANIDASINLPFSAEPTFSLNTTDEYDFVVTINTDTPGIYEEDLVFVDQLCGVTRTVTVKAIVFDPKIDDNGGFDITTTKGGPGEEQTRVITNLSDDDLIIASVTPQDGQFTVVSVTPPLNPTVTLKPGESITVVLKYTPTDDILVNSVLLLEGQPCDFELEVPMIGNPDQARVTIESESLTDYIGQDIKVKVNLNDFIKFIESGTSSITFDLTYDGDMLFNVNGIDSDGDGFYTVKLEDIPIITAPGLFTEVPFFVKEQFAKTQCDLLIENPESDKNNVNFVIASGIFTLNPAIATIKLDLDNYEAEPGKVFQCTLKIADAQNVVVANNGSISTTLRFNAHAMVPYGSTPKGVYSDGQRTIELTNLPIGTGKDYDLIILEFQAVLGNVEETPIFIEDTHTELGFVKFEPVNSNFTLTGLCTNTDGTKRFFDPFGEAGLLSVAPNPASNSVTVRFEVVEEGTTKITLISTSTGTEAILYEDTPAQGEHAETFDLTGFSSGAYMIKMTTPSQEFTEKFFIVK
jgi:type IX secretion system substrate protein